jgi:hypothetical protein
MMLTLIANSLSERAFKALGIEEIAYVKPIIDGTGSTARSMPLTGHGSRSSLIGRWHFP